MVLANDLDDAELPPVTALPFTAMVLLAKYAKEQNDFMGFCTEEAALVVEEEDEETPFVLGFCLNFVSLIFLANNFQSHAVMPAILYMELEFLSTAFKTSFD